MSHYHEPKLKDNPFIWAREEFQLDLGYWLDRAKNGSGLIQEIALFVLKNGQLQPDSGHNRLFIDRNSTSEYSIKREGTKVV